MHWQSFLARPSAKMVTRQINELIQKSGIINCNNINNKGDCDDVENEKDDDNDYIYNAAADNNSDCFMRA